MANWCYGTILVSGKKTDVHNFIENGLVPAKSINPTEQATITKVKRDDYYEIECEPSLTRVYVDHLYGCFLTEDTIDILSSDDDNDYTVELHIEIKDPMRKEYVTETAKKYNVNINIDITDERMQLRQLFVVDKDGNIKEDKPLDIEE